MDSLGLSSAQSLQALSALLFPQELSSEEQPNVRSESMLAFTLVSVQSVPISLSQLWFFSAERVVQPGPWSHRSPGCRD